MFGKDQLSIFERKSFKLIQTLWFQQKQSSAFRIKHDSLDYLGENNS
jgi:hypothetical protein